MTSTVSDDAVKSVFYHARSLGFDALHISESIVTRDAVATATSLFAHVVIYHSDPDICAFYRAIHCGEASAIHEYPERMIRLVGDTKAYKAAVKKEEAGNEDAQEGVDLSVLKGFMIVCGKAAPGKRTKEWILWIRHGLRKDVHMKLDCWTCSSDCIEMWENHTTVAHPETRACMLQYSDNRTLPPTLIRPRFIWSNNPDHTDTWKRITTIKGTKLGGHLLLSSNWHEKLYPAQVAPVAGSPSVYPGPHNSSGGGSESKEEMKDGKEERRVVGDLVIATKKTQKQASLKSWITSAKAA